MISAGRTKYYHIVLALFVGLFFTQAAIAQNAAKLPPDLGEKLWKKSFDASHGSSKLSTLHISGTYALNDRIRWGDFSLDFEAPDSDLIVFDTWGHGIARTGREHGKSWIKLSPAPDGLPVTMLNGVPFPLLAQVWRSMYETDWHDTYSKIEVLGRATLKGHSVYVIRLATKRGDPENRYLDADSFLLVRSDHLQRFKLPGDKDQRGYMVSFYYYDYRDIEGIKIPRRIEATGEPESLEFDLSSVQVNNPVNEALFEDPNHSGK